MKWLELQGGDEMDSVDPTKTYFNDLVTSKQIFIAQTTRLCMLRDVNLQRPTRN